MASNPEQLSPSANQMSWVSPVFRDGVNTATDILAQVSSPEYHMDFEGQQSEKPWKTNGRIWESLQLQIARKNLGKLWEVIFDMNA